MTWSVAEGRRGSRWREVRIRDGTIVSSLLLEVDPKGRFSHLELSTVTGLLTLHPEGDGTLHGNAVDASGVHHLVAVPWAPDDVLLVAGSPISRAATTPRDNAPRRNGVAMGVVVGLDLAVERRAIGRTERAVQLDPSGIPALPDGVSWPLELDD